MRQGEREGPSMKKWAIPFQVLECSRCSGVRQRSLPCPECGEAPDEREVDQLLARRRRVVERARRIAADLSREPLEAAPLEDIQRQAGGALDAVFGGIDAVLDRESEEGAASSLGHSLAVIARLRSQLSTTPRRRPFTSVWDGTDYALAHLDTSAGLFVQALCQSNMSDAQRLASDAQRSLDVATEPLAAATVTLDDLTDSLAGSSAQMLGFLAHRTAQRDLSGGSAGHHDPYESFVEEAALSDDRFEYLLAFEDERARLFLDRPKFWSLVGETYRQLKDSPEFERLLQDTAWRRRFLAASDQLADVGVAAEAIATAAYHERQLVRTDLEAIKTLLEGPAKTLLRTRLCAHRRRPFAQVDGDATAIVEQAKQAGMAAATLGLRKELRHAISHEDFDVDDGILVLDPGKSSERRIERDELVDAVLAALESTLAMHTAVTVLLWRFDDELAGEAGRRAVSPEQAVWLSFRLAEYDISAVTIEDGTIGVVLADPFDSCTLTTVAGLTWLLPAHSETLELVSEVDGRLVGPLAPFREFASETDEWKRDLRLWGILTAWRWNDHPVAGPSLWRCWVATIALRTHDDDSRAAIKRLRDLRDFAARLDDHELVGLVKDVLRFHQHRLMRLPMADADISRMMEQLGEWSTRPDRWPKLIPQS